MAGVVRAINGSELNRQPKDPATLPEAGFLNVGDFRIDLDQRTVVVRNKHVDLAATEFDLLVFLVGHPKRMVTAQTMLKTQWGEDGVHQTQFLQVLLSLRKKLEATGAGDHYIRTESLVVYRFDPLG